MSLTEIVIENIAGFAAAGGGVVRTSKGDGAEAPDAVGHAEDIADLKGLNRRSPWYAFVMLLLMFSLAGVPPTVGFYAKLSVLQPLLAAGMTWLAVVAVLIKQEILLVFIGGVFGLEALSVILQVGSFKLRGKRIFKMAPVHHHFEQIGWPESKVIIRFWIVGIILALVSLSSLKLR